MYKRLTDLVLQICSEPDAYIRLILIDEMKELLDAERERLSKSGRAAQASHSHP